MVNAVDHSRNMPARIGFRQSRYQDSDKGLAHNQLGPAPVQQAVNKIARARYLVRPPFPLQAAQDLLAQLRPQQRQGQVYLLKVQVLLGVLLLAH